MPISTAPAVEPAMIDRKALGLSFFLSGSLVCCAVAILWNNLGEKNWGCKQKNVSGVAMDHLRALKRRRFTGFQNLRKSSITTSTLLFRF